MSRIDARLRGNCMYSRSSKATLSVMTAIAFILTTGMGVSVVELCIAADHITVERALVADCSSRADTPHRTTESPSSGSADSASSGSCMDIPLNGATAYLAAHSRPSGASKVLACAIPTDAYSVLVSVSTPTRLFRSENRPHSAISVVSATVLRI